MATYGPGLRRGLPRVPGGEPWPPASAGMPEPESVAAVPAAAAPVAAAPVAAVPEPVAVVPESQDRDDFVQSRAEDGAQLHENDAVAGAAAGASATAAAVPVAARSVAARSVRRGLPRVPGGEPWPPVPDAAAAAAVPSHDRDDFVQLRGEDDARLHEKGAVTAAAGAAAAAAAGADAGRGAGQASTAAQTQAPASAPAQDADAVAAPALRRGLPRVPGGEPWPAASFVPRRPAPVAGAAAGGIAAVLSPVAGAETAVAPVHRGAGEPTRAGVDPAVQAPGVQAAGTQASGTHVAGAQTSGTPAAETQTTAGTLAEPAGPLPFAPTVFETASSRRWSALRAERAGKGPVPAPEPARIGPFTRGQWAGVVVVGGAGLLFAAGMLVLIVRWLLSLEPLQDFLATYPGEYHLPEAAPVGLPAWIGWQHFFNVFLMVLIIRSGLQVRHEKRPSAFWSPRRNKKRKISLSLWFHQSLDILWLVNGVIFVVLLFVTGQWMRIVPTSWEVFPNALSAALQYVSLDWPTENGWVNYNGLQQLAYFTTVFVAAPLAAVTGVRMSGVWPKEAKTLNRIYPVEWARAVHFPVMIYFVLFIVVHVFLVLATGALRNLNHMYAAQDAVNWVGFWLFVASLVAIAGAWVAARPLVLAPIARLFGTVSSR